MPNKPLNWRKCREKILQKEPSLQSRAALILLKRQLKASDSFVPEYQKWLDFRLEVLAEREKEFGPQFCFYCSCGPLLAEVDQKNPSCATLDHVHPLCKGGAKYDKNNLVVCCQPCNQKKKDMDLQEFLRLFEQNLLDFYGPKC